jgi:replicative DNA helicase
MRDVEIMQKLLEEVILRISELEEKISELNKEKTPCQNSVELRSVKAKLASQHRVKITLVQSIQELTPSSNTMTLFTPLKPSRSLFGRIASFFRG